MLHKFKITSTVYIHTKDKEHDHAYNVLVNAMKNPKDPQSRAIIRELEENMETKYEGTKTKS